MYRTATVYAVDVDRPMTTDPIQFEPLEDRPGVAVLDPIEGRRVELSADERAFEPADTRCFLFPVDAAIAIETGHVRFDRGDFVRVWTDDGEALDRVQVNRSRSFDAGTYQIDVSGPIKETIRLEGPFTIAVRADRIDVDLGGERRVLVGARSQHEHPAATITIGDDTEDVMAAISAFSSALKTSTPDRSYPTLRGHPPLIEVGDRLSIPSGVEPREEGIAIEVPRMNRLVYPTAPLSFYLGATVRPGRSPRIVTTDGFEYPFDGERWFEDEVAAVLRHVLLLDAVVRTAGPFESELAERTAVEPLLGTDLETLYEAPMRERLAEYLSIPREAVDDVGPRWAMTAYVPPTTAGAAALPFVVNELGIVRSPRGTRIDAREARVDIGLPEERSRRYLLADRQRLLIRPDFFDDSVEHVWFGEDVPVGATKGTLEAFRAALDRRSEPGNVSVAVVTTDPGTLEGRAPLTEDYLVRESLPIDLETFVGADVARLRSILTADYDFLHFVGRTVPGGLVADDGTVLLDDLESVRVGAFFLEADHSFEEALWLARHGALGGIGTIGRVGGDSATAIGRSIPSLLAHGFPLRAALDIVRDREAGGQQYVVVGNGSVDIASSEAVIPNVLNFERAGDDVRLTMDAYPSGIFRVGSAVTSNLSGAVPHIGPGSYEVDGPLGLEAVRRLVTRSEGPAVVNGRIHWTRTSTLDALGLDGDGA